MRLLLAKRPNDAPFLVLFGTASNVLDDLPSAFGADSDLEKLVRGSLTTNDPFVGPVALPGNGIGTYYVAITESDRQPASLSMGNVVREPINSVTRLVEDRFDDVASVTDVAGVTVFDLFDRDENDGPLPAGFGLNNDFLFGHGKPEGFATTTVENPSGFGSDTVFEYVRPLPTPAVNPPSDPADEWPSDDNPPKFYFDLDTQAWSLVETDTIGTAASLLGGSINTSTTIAHLSVDGSLAGAGDQADFYKITIPAGGGELTVDIDGGFDMGQSVDTKVHLFNLDAFGLPLGNVLVLGGNFNQNQVSGSVMVEDGMLGSVSLNDPFLTEVLPAGNYLIAVMGETATPSYNPDTPEINVGAGTEAGDYIMRVSLDTKAATITTTNTGNGDQYLEFDRSVVNSADVSYGARYSLFTSGADQMEIVNPTTNFTVRYVDAADPDPLLDLPPTANFVGGVLTVSYNSQAVTPTNADYAAIMGAINGVAGFTASVVDPAVTLGTDAFPASDVGQISIDYLGEVADISITNTGFFGPSNSGIQVVAAAPGFSDYRIVFDDSDTNDAPPSVVFNPFTSTLTIQYNPNATPGSLNGIANLVAAIDNLPEFSATQTAGGFNARLPVVVFHLGADW